MKDMTPIEVVIETVMRYAASRASSAGEIDDYVIETGKNIAKRELAMAVPAATASTHGKVDCVTCWNACLRKLGVLDE